MTLDKIRRQLRRIEDRLACRPNDGRRIALGRPAKSDSTEWLRQLQALSVDVQRLKQKAEIIGDDRGVLAAVGELRRIVELLARLTGQIEERAVNLVHVEIDPETARRIAVIYLARHPMQKEGSK